MARTAKGDAGDATVGGPGAEQSGVGVLWHAGEGEGRKKIKIKIKI